MEKTLVILAAGMGSRFGGLKQIKEVGPSGECIIDYSVHDAIKAGFNKIVFVVKKSFQKEFQEKVGNRIEKHVKVEYVNQENDTIESKIPLNREKSLGTGHALYCVKDVVKAPFALISADDFYGPSSFKLLSEYLDNNNDMAVVGFSLLDTVREGFEVKRGVIRTKEDFVTGIIESKVKNENGTLYCTPLVEEKPFVAEKDALTGMLMYAFGFDIFAILKEDFEEYINTSDLMEDEFMLTVSIDKCIKMGKTKILRATEKSFGLTFPEDLENVRNQIKMYIEKGVYKENLWEEK